MIPPADDKPPRESEEGSFHRATGTELALQTLDPLPLPPVADEPEEKTRWSYTQTKKMVQAILGAKRVMASTVRLWKRDNGRIEIGMERNGKKVVLGEGIGYQQAFENIFIAPIRAREEAMAAAEDELAAVKG